MDNTILIEKKKTVYIPYKKPAAHLKSDNSLFDFQSGTAYADNIGSYRKWSATYVKKVQPTWPSLEGME